MDPIQWRWIWNRRFSHPVDEKLISNLAYYYQQFLQIPEFHRSCWKCCALDVLYYKDCKPVHEYCAEICKNETGLDRITLFSSGLCTDALYLIWDCLKLPQQDCAESTVHQVQSSQHSIDLLQHAHSHLLCDSTSSLLSRPRTLPFAYTRTGTAHSDILVQSVCSGI